MIIIITCLIVFPLDLVSFSYTKLFVTCNIYSNTFKVFNDKTNKYISTLKPWIQSNNQTIMFYIHFCFEISTRWRPLSKLTSKQSVLWKKMGFQSCYHYILRNFARHLEHVLWHWFSIFFISVYCWNHIVAPIGQFKEKKTIFVQAYLFWNV